MEISLKNVFCAYIVILITIIVNPVYNAPPAKYDQKQSGDYNVQLHLKDFHIIAVLGDGAWGGDGDYDYNYDYSDLTIKPSLPLTTENPQNLNLSEVENQQKPEGGAEKPNEKPDVILSSTSPATLIDSLPTIPVVVISENENGNKNKPENLDNTQKPVKLEETHDKKTESPVTNISIVPASESKKDINQNKHQLPQLPLGEVRHYRKCAEGFSRDKQGRCRKIRRTPYLPFGLTRFATNLASRFRQTTMGDSSVA